MMKVNRSCKTCEFNFGDYICGIRGELGFGGKIRDFEKQRVCWAMSQDYINELLGTLPEEDKLLFLSGNGLGRTALILRIETGNWAPKEE